MDVRSKLKLFNNEVLVYSGSCTINDGEVQPIFQDWKFPDGCRGSSCGGYFASQEWVEACAFFREIRACGFTYSKSCGFSVYPAAGAHLNFSCKGSFFVKACNSTIEADCVKVNAYCVKINSEDAINFYTNLDNGCAYLQIGNYESEDQDKVGVKVYGDDVIISSTNKTSIDSGTLDISSDGDLDISVGGIFHINSYCTEMSYINVSTFSTFDGGVYFKPDSSIEFCGKTTFTSFPPEISEELIITQDNHLVPKSYVDNATAKKFSCTYTDTEEHTISIDKCGIYFNPEKIRIIGCSGRLCVNGESDDSRINFEVNTGFSSVPSISTSGLCLGAGFGSAYFATEAYVERKLSIGTYCSLFNNGLIVGKGACVVRIETDTDVILFDETELPTTGGTVATQDYVEESMKSLPYTCIYNLGQCIPVNGIASWEITLMCGDQYVASIIPPHVSILKNDPSTTLGGTYVNADVSVNIMDDVGIPSETRIKIEMNATETVPANTFKAVVSNIYARCF